MPRHLLFMSRSMPRHAAALLALGILLHAPAVTAASPFLLPDQFDIDARTNTIAIQSGIAGDNFFVSNRNFKTDYLIQSPDGSSLSVPATAVLSKFNVLETDVSKPGTYRIQTSNTALLPTRFALIEGQWLRVMQPRPNGDKPKDDKGGADKHGSDMKMPAKDAAPTAKAAAPLKAPTSIRADMLPPDAKIITSNSLNSALSYMTKGAPTPVAAFSDQGFEVRPITHPSEVYATDGFKFAVRQDGQPVAGLTFSVTRGASGYDKDAKRDRAPVVTDSAGIATVRFDQPGVYLMATSYPGNNPDRTQQPALAVVNFGLTIEVAP
jgi:hypothetical protein